MRSSRPEERKNDFESAVVIPTSLCYVYISQYRVVRGEVEQKRKARDELDLWIKSSLPFFFSTIFLPLSSFLRRPCPFPSHTHSLAHSPARKRSVRLLSCVHWHDLPTGIKIGNNSLSDAIDDVARKIPRLVLSSIVDARVYYLRETHLAHGNVRYHDSKSARFSSAPLKRGRRERTEPPREERRGIEWSGRR